MSQSETAKLKVPTLTNAKVHAAETFHGTDYYLTVDITGIGEKQFFLTDEEYATMMDAPQFQIAKNPEERIYTVAELVRVTKEAAKRHRWTQEIEAATLISMLQTHMGFLKND